MNEMVERVAQSINEALFGRGAARMTGVDKAARAAIAAMREPTPEMTDHFGDWMGDQPEHHKIARELWQEAIDIALGEAP